MSDTQTNLPKKKKERSVAYPGVSLSQSIDFTKDIRSALGSGPYSREEAAKALGHESLTGPAARKVAALVHFGLLSRTGNTYSQSELASNIINFISEEEKERNIQQAALEPKLYKSLHEKFLNQSLPKMFPSILMREGVSESAAAEVARLFIDSMEFAGLLRNGVVVSGDSNNLTQDNNIPPQSEQPYPGTETNNKSNPVEVQLTPPGAVNQSSLPIADGVLTLLMPASFKDLLLNSDDEELEAAWKNARKALKTLSELVPVENTETDT